MAGGDGTRSNNRQFHPKYIVARHIACDTLRAIPSVRFVGGDQQSWGNQELGLETRKRKAGNAVNRETVNYRTFRST
jgi:hypothetical protein